MGVWSLRHPHSRGDIQTRTSRREAHGEGPGVAGPGGGGGGSVPRSGSGHRTTAWLGLSPAQTPGSKKQSGTPGPRGADGMTQKPGWMWQGPAGLARCPPITREAGRAPELGAGGGGAAVTLSSPESFPGQGVGAPTRGDARGSGRERGAPGPPGAVSAGRRLRPAPVAHLPPGLPPGGRASLLAPHPLAPCCLRETFDGAALHFRAGRPTLWGLPF